MKQLKIFILLFLAATFLHGCGGPADSAKDKPSVQNTGAEVKSTQQEVVTPASSLVSMKSFTCGDSQAFKNETFYPDLEAKVKDYIGKTIFPRNEKDTKGSAIEVSQNDYITSSCLNKDKGIVLVEIYYDYQMMGGWSYAFRYDIATNSLKPATMTGDTENMTLMNFSAENGSIMTLTGTGGDGIPNDYTAKYDYEKNEVSP